MTKKVALCVQIPEEINNLVVNLSKNLDQSKTQILCNAIMAYASSSGNIVIKDEVKAKEPVPEYSLEELILLAPYELHLVDKIKGMYGEISSDVVSKVYDFVTMKGQLTSKTVVYNVLKKKDWMK